MTGEEKQVTCDYFRARMEWYKKHIAEREKFEQMMDSVCSVMESIDFKVQRILEQKEHIHHDNRS